MSSSIDEHLLQPLSEYSTEPDPFALAADCVYGLLSADPDTMHLHEALASSD